MGKGLCKYSNYISTDIQWNKSMPNHWVALRGKRNFNYKKEVNSQYQCANILSLTLRGVINNSLDNPVGLVPKDYATYQIFNKDDLVFKLIDLENYKTSRVGLVHERGIMSPAYIRISINTNGIVKYFYYQYYDMYLRGVFNRIGDGVRATLSGKDLLNLPIVVPPKEEQDQIVRYLDSKLAKINKFIRNKKRLIELLKEQKQAVINQAVTKGLDPDAKMKPSGVEWLGDVPEGWEVKPLKTVLASLAINTKCKTDNELYIGLENVESWTGRIINIDKETVFESQAKKYSTGNILFGKLRPYLAKVAIPKQEGVCSGEFLVLELKNKYNIGEFIENVLRSFGFISLVNRSTYGAKMPRAEWGLIGGTKIGLPSQSEQIKIVEFITAAMITINQTIDRIEKEIDLMSEYRISLISAVVTGKVDVRGIKVEEPPAEDLAALEPAELEADELQEEELFESEVG